MIYDDLTGSSAPNDADKGHQVSRHSSQEKPQEHVPSPTRNTKTSKTDPTSHELDLGDTVKSPIGQLSRKNSRGMSGDTLGSRNSRRSGHESKVEKFVHLRNPSIKQTLALFKVKVEENGVALLEKQVRQKREDNKELMRKIKEAEAMLKSLEIRQVREKSTSKKKSKLYKRKAISAIRKIGSAPGKKGNTSLFMRNLKKQMMKREKEQKQRKDNRRQKELKKKQRKAIEEIIKEGIENEKLRRRLNDALKRFAKKLDQGKIDSALMDEELERILDLRRVAQTMGMSLFGTDFTDEQVRESYKNREFHVFHPNEGEVNQSTFVDVDRLNELDFQRNKNKSVSVGRGSKSMLGTGTLERIKGKQPKRILAELEQLKLWKTGGKKKVARNLRKSGMKTTIKKTSKKTSNMKYKTKSGKVYNGRGTKSKPKRTKSAIKRSKSPLSKSQYKMINEKKKKLKKSLLQGKRTPKNTQRRELKKRKPSQGPGKKAKSSKTQKSYTDKYEENRGKRDFSGGKNPPAALDFESFKGKTSIEKSAEKPQKMKSKSRSRPKNRAETHKKGVKLYMDKLKKKRDFADGKIELNSKLWGTRPKSKSKGPSRKRRKGGKKMTLESQIVSESQVNEIIADESLGHASGELKNSKMSLLSGQVSGKKIEKRPKRTKTKSRTKVYKSNMQKPKRSTKKLSGKKPTKARKGKSQKKGTRKKKPKKAETKKKSDQLTNSDFRLSKLERSDSIGPRTATVQIENGELMGQSPKRRREHSAKKKRRPSEGSRFRETRRSAEVVRGQEESTRRSILGENEPIYRVKEETRKLVVQMSLDGEVILKEEENGSEETEKDRETKLAELDEFMRSSAKKEGIQRKLDKEKEKNWDEELVNVEKQFEKNLKDSSEKMIDTKMIDEELRKLEEMEKSFKMENRRKMDQFGKRVSGSSEPEKQNLVKIVSFGPNGNSFLFAQNEEQENSETKHSLTETQIQQKLRNFDRRNIFCGPEMQFSYHTKSKIDDELVKIGRSGLTLSKLQKNKIMGEIMSRINKFDPGTNHANIFEKNGSGRENLENVPTAEFQPEIRRNTRGRPAPVFNDFQIEIDGDDLFPNDQNLAEEDISRPSFVGRRRQVEPILDGMGRRSEKVNRFRNNPSREKLQKLVSEDRKREVIIQKLNESGVRDPSMGKPELQKTMRTLESEFNSIPENLKEFN